jgi:hypothetical protein
VNLLNKKHNYYFGNRDRKVKLKKPPQNVFTTHKKASIKNKLFPFQVLAHSTSWDEIDSNDVKLMQKHRSSLLGAELENDVYQKLTNLFSNRNDQTSKRQNNETSERRNDEMSILFSNQNVEPFERGNDKTSNLFSNRKVENTVIFSGWKDNGSKEKTGTV